MLLSVREIEVNKARPSCSTGPSLSSSAAYRWHITKAELSKQKIIETNKQKYAPWSWILQLHSERV